MKVDVVECNRYKTLSMSVQSTWSTNDGAVSGCSQSYNEKRTKYESQRTRQPPHGSNMRMNCKRLRLLSICPAGLDNDSVEVENVEEKSNGMAWHGMEWNGIREECSGSTFMRR